MIILARLKAFLRSSPCTTRVESAAHLPRKSDLGPAKHKVATSIAPAPPERARHKTAKSGRHTLQPSGRIVDFRVYIYRGNLARNPLCPEANLQSRTRPLLFQKIWRCHCTWGKTRKDEETCQVLCRYKLTGPDELQAHLGEAAAPGNANPDARGSGDVH